MAGNKCNINYNNKIITISGVAERWVNKEFFLSKKIKKYNSSDNGDMSNKKEGFIALSPKAYGNLEK